MLPEPPSGAPSGLDEAAVPAPEAAGADVLAAAAPAPAAQPPTSAAGGSQAAGAFDVGLPGLLQSVVGSIASKVGGRVWVWVWAGQDGKQLITSFAFRWQSCLQSRAFRRPPVPATRE